MSAPRRYSEREIAAIFEKAARAQEQAQPLIEFQEGLTLGELQEIGREAGIAPDFIARAAASLTHTVSSAPPRRLAGMPIGVERTVELPGPLSAEAWDRLVVDLRETFQATGYMREEGSIRSWRNGNLQAHVEPTATGYRLRLATTKGNAQQTLALSAFFLAIGAVFLSLLAFQADPEAGMVAIMSLFAAAGVGGLGYTALSLPRWASERGRQMEAVIERVLDLEGARHSEGTSDVTADATSESSLLDLSVIGEVETETPSVSATRVRV
ncbi:MAG: hypothetical protein AAFN13_16610 [Bacteroidota bacterium]